MELADLMQIAITTMAIYSQQMATRTLTECEYMAYEQACRFHEFTLRTIREKQEKEHESEDTTG